MIDLCQDAHVHTAFSSGRDSINVLVCAAENAGVKELTLADRVGPDTPWLSAYRSVIHRAQGRTEIVLRCGAEVEAIGTDGWLAFPGDLSGLESISVRLSRLPLPAGLIGPDVVRSLIAAGGVRVAEVVEHLVTVTVRAIERVSRYAPTQLARPLEFLSLAGIADADIPDSALAELVSACRSHAAVVEVSERYHTPTARLVGQCGAQGVRLVAASDAHRAPEIGRWDYVRQMSELVVGSSVG